MPGNQNLRELLAAMGAPVVLGSRMSEDTLERKLRVVLDYAQNMSAFADMMPVNPSQLSIWQKPDGEAASQAFKRTSVAELAGQQTGVETRLDVNGNEVSMVSRNTIVVVCEMLASLAELYEQGFRVALFQDEGQGFTIVVRMLGVYALNAQTPIMPLLYEIAETPEAMKGPKIAQFMETQLQGGEGGQLVCNLQELALIHHLLQLNSSNVAPEYEFSLAPDQRAFRRSFIIPLGPLDALQVAKVTHNPGCAVCGSAAVKTCSGCKIERYCSSACQKAHWKHHKEFCRYMQGGTWTDFIFADAPSLNGQKLVGTLIDTSSSAFKLKKPKMHGGDEDSDAPQNKHGDKAFLIKIQRLKDNIGMPELPPFHLFYDRFRTTKGYLEPESNEVAWPALEGAMLPGLNVKMYCWARRVGEWGLSICLDRHPQDAEKTAW
ncbi:unnamed protein product [Peniophora sp. CBMAI 1063]|nr:unnamed protein product [Peniophora sp. CBMAI 1063]